MRILRANVGSNSIWLEEVPESWQRLGGRGLIDRIMLDETPPHCDPLGPFNRLILAPGLLVGHSLSACDRISVGGKSPLTGGIKEANAGGITALQMVWLELQAIIVEGGAPADQGWRLLYIDEQGARFEAAHDLAGLGLQATADRLFERFGEEVGISAIGPGGELQYRAAGITHTDKDRNQTRISARGGLGAVMGSKRLKAIVLNPSRSIRPPLADKVLFRDASRRYIKALRANQQAAVWKQYGTAAMVELCSSRGGLPTRNYSSGDFEGRGRINGEAIHDLNLSRGGQITHACMPGCVIQCSNVYNGPDGERLVTPLEYETVALMGSNLGIDDPDAIARLNARANDLGMDSIEIGATLGIFAEAGLMRWGDGRRALELMEELSQATPLGRILGNGAGLAGKILGVSRVPVVKNQAFPGYDPRAVKATGVTYATSAQGADHTCGNPIRAAVDHTDPAGKVALSREAQYSSAGYDTLGICLFGTVGFGADSSLLPDLVNGRYGWGVDHNYLRELGRETVLMEKEFNRHAGFTAADDRFPEWIYRERLPPTQAVFDVPEDELDAIFEE